MALRIKASLPSENSLRDRRYSSTSVNSNLTATTTAAGEATGLDETPDLLKVLQGIAGQVRRLETDFTDMNIPERYMSVLQELKSKVEEIKRIAIVETERNLAVWSTERAALEAEILEGHRNLDELNAQHSISVQSIKQRYETALNEVEL